MRKIFLFLAALVFALGCGTVGSLNFADGTWAGCTYTKDGKKKGPFPLQIPVGAPLVWEEDDFQINCERIPKAPEPLPKPQ